MTELSRKEWAIRLAIKWAVGAGTVILIAWTQIPRRFP